MSGLHYGPGAKQTGTFYPGPVGGSARVVIAVHGGAWNATLGIPEIAESLQKAGLCVFLVAYDEASPTEPAFPIQVEDMEKAWEYATAHAATYNGNPEDVCFLGSSSGSNIAAMAALKLNAAKAKSVRKYCGLSTPADLLKLLEETWEGKLVNKTWTEALPEALGCSLNTTCHNLAFTELAERFSPTRQVTASNRPDYWLNYNSSNELVPLNQQTALATACKAAGCNFTSGIPSTGKHAKEYWDLVEANVIDFFRKP